MCGICGIVTKKLNNDYSVLVKEGLNEIKHRGPDDVIVFQDEHIAFGYVRLAIRGEINPQFNQPIITKDIVAFGNGEVYLKNDKEVDTNKNDLLPLVEELVTKEENIYKNIDADFAISCYDKENKIFYLARDFFGVKPLYIAWIDGETLAFASEIKALKKIMKNKLQVNKNTILDYLIFGYQLENNTFYNNIFTVSPGSVFKWDLKNDKKVTKNYVDEMLELKYTNSENNKSIYQEINKSILARLQSDQKLGFHLSGGMDSSLIVYLSHQKMAQKECFTAYREQDDNDLIYSKKICNKLKCKQHIIKMEKQNNYNELIKILDTPIMSTGDFVPLKIAEAGYREKVKVLLEGQGADELFLGYSRFKEINNTMNLNDVVSILNNSEISLLQKLFKLDVSVKEINNVYIRMLEKGENNIEKAQRFYIRNFLQELLRIEDHVHMNYSIENRVPFLSLYIRNWLNNNELVINQNSNKMAEYNVHKEINSILVKRKKKENLNGSLNDELIEILKEYKQIINENKIFEQFDYEIMNELLTEEKIKQMSKKEAFLLWHIYNLCIWYRENSYTQKININKLIKERMK